jgi:hypothetical protein
MSRQIVAEALLRTTVWGVRDRVRGLSRLGKGAHKQVTDDRKQITSN